MSESRPLIGVSLPIYNTPIGRLPEMAQWAEAAELDSVWSYEVYHNPYVVLGSAAAATSRIGVGTALAHASTRHPTITANAAADIDELSGGRMLLGLGMGEPQLAEASGGATSRPLTRMSQYIDAVRAAWSFFATGSPRTFESELYQSVFPPAPPVGLFRRSMHREQVPIYLASLRPKMLQLAGEKADGVLGAFFTPGYIRDVVMPNVTEGAARGGRDPGDVDLVSYLICSIHEDRAEARRRARVHVGAYAAWAGFNQLVEHEDLVEDQKALSAAVRERGLAALETATSDALLDAFCISGTPDEVRERFGAYADVAPHVLLHPPSIPPLTTPESEEGFRGILETFGNGSRSS